MSNGKLAEIITKLEECERTADGILVGNQAIRKVFPTMGIFGCKIYPYEGSDGVSLEDMQACIRELSELFLGGKKETRVIKLWTNIYPNCEAVFISEELAKSWANQDSNPLAVAVPLEGVVEYSLESKVKEKENEND